MARIDLKSVPWRRALPLTLVTLVAAAFTVYKVRMAISVGPEWDTYAFLANAAEFAGKGYGYTELHRPPFLSLLTALLFRIGVPMNALVIQVVDGALSLSGILAAYLLARRRVPQLFAAVSALSLLAIQPLWGYLGSGYTDFPSVAISLWMLLACVKATEDNPRYYTLAAVLFVAAVMTRYTALLAVFPALLWTVLRGRPFRHAKAIASAAIAALAAYVPAGVFYTLRFNDAIFPFALALGVSEQVSAPGGEGSKVASGLWYVQSLLGFMSPESLWGLTALVLAVAAIGLAFAIWTSARSWSPAGRSLGFAILGVVPALAAQVLGAGLIARQATIPIAVFAVWRYAGSRDEHGQLLPAGALDATMLAWLLAYFDFHGHQTIQIPRYFITMAFPLLYFTAVGWWQFAANVVRAIPARGPASGWNSSAAARHLAAGVLVVGAIVALTVTATAPPVKPAYEADARESSAWLQERGVRAEDVVYSDLWPLTAWYTRLPIRAMPLFKNRQAFQHELDKSSADYYLSIFAERRRYVGFAQVAQMGDVVILKRTSDASATLPRVLFLGTGWDGYLEDVNGYSFDLDSTAGRYGLAGTAFLDGVTPEELRTYRVVTAAGFKWRNHADAENGLRAYVEDGGVLVVDASQNLNGLAYSVANTIMLDTVVQRRRLPARADVKVTTEFAAAHPTLGTINASPFVDEGGGAWYGAAYEARPDLPPLKTLATIAGGPAIQMQAMGKGRIYWISYNLVWHAYSKDNAEEMRLIKAVFDDAQEVK